MSRKLKITRGSGNVFADVGFYKDEAEHLTLRAKPMIRGALPAKRRASSGDD